MYRDSVRNCRPFKVRKLVSRVTLVETWPKVERTSVNLDSSLGNSVDGVVLVLVGHVVGGGGSSVDGGKLAVIVLHHDTGDKTSDTSESVDSHTGGHGHGRAVRGSLEAGAREAVGASRGNKEGGGGELHLDS